MSSPLTDLEDTPDNDSSCPIPSLMSHLGIGEVTPSNNRHQHMFLPPTSDGPDISSPIVGSKQEKTALRLSKALKRKKAHFSAQKEDQRIKAEAKRHVDLDEVLFSLKTKNLRLGDLLEYVFNPEHGQGNIRWHDFFSRRGSAKQVLDWWTCSRNSPEARDEVHQWAVEYISQFVSREARAVTQSKELQTMRKKMDEKLLTSFSFTKIYDDLCERLASVSMHIFQAFATSNRAHNHTPQRQLRTKTVVTSAALACLGEYSHANNLFKRVLGLYLYATGSQRQSISVLSTLGLSESYANIITQNIQQSRRVVVADSPTSDQVKGSLNLPDNGPTACRSSPSQVTTTTETQSIPTGTLRQLSASMRDMARQVASTGLFGTVYDNINIVFRNAEQVVGRHDSQENGTCATLFPLFKAKLDDIKLRTFQEAFDQAVPLKVTDILHTPDESKQFRQNLIFTIIRIIIAHGGEGFKIFEKDLAMHQPTSPAKIEVHRTDLHPLPSWNIDESTIIGNAEVDEAIVKELHLRKNSNFPNHVRFQGGDQLSLARLRALENIRAGQEAGYNSFFWGAWIPGLFHGKIADMHGLLFTHWGKPNAGARNPGCLAFHNTRLDRLPITLTSLPNFRTCRDLIFVSLYARVIHCLLLVSKHASLEEYLSSVSSWDTLFSHANEIYERFTKTSVVEELRWKRKMQCSGQSNDLDNSNPVTPTEGDMVFENAVLFLRDTLISREYTDAIKAGDSGWVLLVLKIWALSFRGSGRTKYAYEMLHIIHNLTHVWPESIREIVLNNWLLNPTGHPNSFVEMDLVQEHLNFWTKEFYAAHGSNASWEWLELIGPIVNALRHLANGLHKSLGTDQGTQHNPPDLNNDIHTLVESLDEHNIYRVQKGRQLDSDDLPIKDIISVGLQNLTDNTKSPLAEYNEAFLRLQQRRRMQPVDTLQESPTPDLTPSASTLPDAPVSSQHTIPMTPRPIQMADIIPQALDQNTLQNSELDTYKEGEIEACGNELLSILDELVSGAVEPTLTRETASDVALDMDVVLVSDELGPEVLSESEDEEDTEAEGSDEGEDRSW